MTRISFIMLIVFSLFVNCKKQTTEPKTVNEYEPDTTSHNFVWRADTLGELNASILRDVAIINDTLIWAVGELVHPGDREFYGAAVWNGKEWKLKLLMDSVWNSPVRPYGIWAFSENDIWLVSGNIWKWNGEKLIAKWPGERIIPKHGFTKIWAAKKELYIFYGSKGRCHAL